MKKNGFTLIELVVVIVILGILAVVAAPKFMNLQVDAKDASLKGLKGAIESTLDVTYAKLATLGLENAAMVQMVGSPDPSRGLVISDKLSALGCKGNGACVFEYGYPSNYAPTLALLVNGISDNSAAPSDDFVAVSIKGDPQQSLAITFKNNVKDYKGDDGKAHQELKTDRCYIKYPRPSRESNKPILTIIPCE